MPAFPDTLSFLETRRSHPARALGAPAPGPEALARLLAIAARVPDHGKLAPWRFVVLSGPALPRLAALAEARGAALGLDPEQVLKGRRQFAESPLAVVVLSAPVQPHKVPVVEQVLSAGAVCLQLLNAATAAGFGANWLTGWVAHDATFAAEAFGAKDGETVAGIVHIGTVTTDSPDRPRPDVTRLTTWVSA